MGKLDSLKITECPYAFASFARSINGIVDILATMRGENGITVVVAEKNAIIRSDSDFESRISALEDYLDEFTETEAEICPTGTVTILTK